MERHADTAVIRALEELDLLLAMQTPPSDTAAVVMEPVLGEGGYFPAPRAFMRAVRDMCTRHGILFVADEVQTGFGRTGRMFAVEHASVVPDVIVMAKGIASGFPIAGIGARRELMDRWAPGAHGGTYGANPMGCAAALATLDVIIEEDLPANAEARGSQLFEGLRCIAAQDPGVGDVRGLGLMVAAGLTRSDRSPDAERTMAVLARCLHDHRVILMSCGTHGNVVRFVPPLIVDEHQIDTCLRAFGDAVTATTR